MHCTCFLSWLLLISFLSKAQFSDSTKYHVAYSCGGNYNQTPDSKGFLLNNLLNLNYKSPGVVYNINIKQFFGKQTTRLTNEDYYALFDINKYAFVPGFYFWGLASYASVYSLKLNHQVQSGCGIAYTIIDKKWLRFNLSDGLLYDYNDIRHSATENEVRETPRNSFRAQLKLYVKHICTVQSAYFIQNSLEHKHDVIYKSETQLSVKIRGYVSANVQLQYNRMTRTDRETLFITFGLQFSRFF